MIYASEHYSTAMLEMLARWNGPPPGDQPSVVARMDRNVIINADHPDFPRLRPGPETPVWWDERLFD